MLWGVINFLHGSGALGCFGGLDRWIHLGTEIRGPRGGGSIDRFGRCSHSLDCVARKGAKGSHRRALDPNLAEAERDPQEAEVLCIPW